MLNAILSSKSGRVSPEDQQNLRWRDIFRGSEDLITATIFERLAYLAAETAWNLLASASGSQLHAYRLAEITTMEFWPIWSTEDRARGVEPDVFIAFELGDPVRKFHMIVESKYGGVQSAWQLKEEILAWRQAVLDEIDTPDHLVVVAIGGLRTGSRRQRLEDAFRDATVDLADVAGELSLVMIDWSDFARAFALHKPQSPHEGRIVEDLRRSLELYGYHHAIQPVHLERFLAHRRVKHTLAAVLMDMNRSASQGLIP